MSTRHSFPFALGATSYVIEGGLVENARFLAGKVDDMELVLFDLSEDVSNLPSKTESQTLASIGHDHQLTYSVHLPLDLCRVPDDTSLMKAKKVLSTTHGLPISAVIAHIEDWYWRRQNKQGFDPFLLAQWQRQALQALSILQQSIPPNVPICIENLESYPPEAVVSLAAASGCALCIDIGHLWKFHHLQPMNFLAEYLPQAKVLHLHGYANGIDHLSIQQLPETKLNTVCQLLTNSGFHGILTMEVFGEDDFQTSLSTMTQTLKRIITP